jgi:hypothetical protein
MISSGSAIHILWLSAIAIEAAIVLVVAKRKLLLRVPFFFSYVVSMLARDIVLLFVPYPGNLYARVYWYGEIVTIFLALAVIFETIRQLFPQYPFLKVALRLATALGAAVACAGVLMVVLTELAPGKDRVFDLIVLAERSVKFVEAGWLILVIMLASHVGSNWRQYSIGIVAGFGVHAALTLAIFELRTHANLVSNAAFVLGNLGAYNISAIIWAFFFLRPAHEPRFEFLPEANLSEWNDAVLAYKQQCYRR